MKFLEKNLRSNGITNINAPITNIKELLTLQITPSQSKIKTSTASNNSDWGSLSFDTLAIRSCTDDEVNARVVLLREVVIIVLPTTAEVRRRLLLNAATLLVASNGEVNIIFRVAAVKFMVRPDGSEDALDADSCKLWKVEL